MDRVVIAGGKVVDGTGAPAVAADVAIEGDRIVEIGAGLRGDRRLDADGCVVAPGFVDIHTHYDAQVFWDPALTPSCYHGVTTVVAGNCGFSIAPTRPADRDLLGRTMEKVEDMDPERARGRDPVGGVRDVPRVPRRRAQTRVGAQLLRVHRAHAAAALRARSRGGRSSRDSRRGRGDGRADRARRWRRARPASPRAWRSRTSVQTVDRSPAASLSQRRRKRCAGRWAAAGAAVIGVNGRRGPVVHRVLRPAAELRRARSRTPRCSPCRAARTSRPRRSTVSGRAQGADVWPQVSCRPLAFSVNLVEPFNLNTNPCSPS